MKQILGNGKLSISQVTCENIRFSSLFAAGDVWRETSPAAKSVEKRMFSQATCITGGKLTQWARSIQPKCQPVRPGKVGRDPFNQNSDRSDREKRTTSKGGPVFSKLFRLDRTDPLSCGPKFPEILVEWIAPVWSTSKGGPIFSKLFRLDRTYPLSFGPKFPEILVERIAPSETSRHWFSL